MDPSYQAFPAALDVLLGYLDTTQNKLGIRAREIAKTRRRPAPGRGTGSLGKTMLSKLRKGESQLQPWQLEVIASAASTFWPGTTIKPTYFREYREHLAAERAREVARVADLADILAALGEIEGRALSEPREGRDEPLARLGVSAPAPAARAPRRQGRRRD